MRSVLLILFFVVSLLPGMSQDFVSRFMENREPDPQLESVTISPKMMKEVMKLEIRDENDDILEIISNLNSMQMITTGENGKKYFDEALEIMERNANRFDGFLPYNEGTEDFRIMFRKRNNTIIELVMLSNESNKFIVINFTGNMNIDFITRLANSMDLRKIK